jgi:hypothetical protein
MPSAKDYVIKFCDELKAGEKFQQRAIEKLELMIAKGVRYNAPSGTSGSGVVFLGDFFLPPFLGRIFTISSDFRRIFFRFRKK